MSKIILEGTYDHFDSVFPSEHFEYGKRPGITLLDYFAGIVLGAVVDSELTMVENGSVWGGKEIAELSYRMAHEMIKARESVLIKYPKQEEE